MRVVLNQLMIFEGAGFALVTIHHHVLWEHILGQEAPLHAGREARAAAPAQPRVFDDAHHLFRFHATERLVPGGITVIRLVDG